MDSKIKFSDVIGPSMVGPSSSHTAGACRIGNIARAVYGKDPEELHIDLHGSFAETYHGHGTDRALVAGSLGYQTDDNSIINALEIAEERNIPVSYQKKDLGPVHPNTARINYLENGEIVCSVTGSSIGGGQVRVIEIDGVETNIDGKTWTIILTYQDRPNMIFDVSSRVSKYALNIATMSVTREETDVTLIAEFDKKIPEELREEIASIEDLTSCRVIPYIS